ncbi:MAG: DUF2339 domain-containing protein [Rhizobiaceae bacterium]
MDSDYGWVLVLIVLVAAGAMVWQHLRLGRIEAELRGLRAALSSGAPAPVQAVETVAAVPATPPVAREAAAAVAAPVVVATPALPEPVAPTVPSTPVQPPPMAALPPHATLAEVLMAERAAARAAEHVAPKSAPSPRATGRDVETALGSRWAVWVGGVALALGAIFLIRYTIEVGIFGPRLRLMLAAIFGALLIAAGEWLRRRRGFRVPIDGLNNAYVPAILTAAGAFALFGSAYAAHAVYGYIGPVPAFILLGLIGLVTITSALLHGQALAGLGVVGSYLTPALVATETPDAWTLFVYLAVVLTAAAFIARIRRWPLLMAAALAGPGIWCLLYVTTAAPPDLNAVLFMHAAIFAVLARVWLRDIDTDVDGVSIMPAALTAFIAVVMAMNEPIIAVGGPRYAAILSVAMLAVAAWKKPAIPLLFGAVVTCVVTQLRIGLSGEFHFRLLGDTVDIQGLPALQVAGDLWLNASVAAIFALVGLGSARRHAREGGFRPTSWAASAALLPLVVLFCNWVAFGNLDIDPPRAAVAFALALVFIAGAEWIARAETPPHAGGSAVSMVLGAAALALAIGWTLAFKPGTTSVLMAMTGGLAALATRWRPWPILGWLSVASVFLMLARVLIDPTIVGVENLSTTPVFNEMLAGYGLPALFFGLAARQLARTTGGTPRHAMEVAAVLFVLLAIAMLVRHALHGGDLYAAALGLDEQAIYTLVAIGAAALLVALDGRSASPVWHGGSIVLGVAAKLMLVLMHFLLLNPLYSEETTGPNGVFNLLLLGYLLPAIGMGGLALYARHRRPYWYVASLALVAAASAVIYFSLAMRRLFVGEVVGLWQGMSQLETYSYSALWLVLGVLLLIVGAMLNSRVLRAASGGLVVVAVAKVFIFDMAELEGVLRALSFIGLGVVLIGIGLFYQRMLARTTPAPDQQPTP